MKTSTIEVKVADGLYQGFRVKFEDAESIRQRLSEIWYNVQIVEHLFPEKMDVITWDYDDIVRYLNKH